MWISEKDLPPNKTALFKNSSLPDSFFEFLKSVSFSYDKILVSFLDTRFKLTEPIFRKCFDLLGDDRQTSLRLVEPEEFLNLFNHMKDAISRFEKERFKTQKYSENKKLEMSPKTEEVSEKRKQESNYIESSRKLKYDVPLAKTLLPPGIINKIHKWQKGEVRGKRWKSFEPKTIFTGTAGGITGAVFGAVIGGPIGCVVGSVVGGVMGIIPTKQKFYTSPWSLKAIEKLENDFFALPTEVGVLHAFSFFGLKPSATNAEINQQYFELESNISKNDYLRLQVMMEVIRASRM